MTPPEWWQRGRPHLWLPYTQMHTATAPLAVVGAEGCRLHLADGRVLIDGIASWWTACHGYGQPHLQAAVARQAAILPHVMFGGLIHEQAAMLAARLSARTGLPRVFFADSGSVAVEIALKMALQYWMNQGAPGRNRFLCFKHGYHGDTMGAMAVSDPSAMHKAFRSYASKNYVVEVPSDEYGFAELDELLAGVHKNIAALIIEPLVQAAGGMKFHSADMLAEIVRIARRYDILVIFDEIATGFHRTGPCFAYEETGALPDILCIGKALTGGMMTLAAVLASDQVFGAFLSDDADHAFMHGPTYMANPLSCAAANASLDLFDHEPRAQQVEALESALRLGLAPCKTLPCVEDVRVKGAIGVVQTPLARSHKADLKARFLAHGVWLRPLEDVIYLMPALTVTSAELATLTQAVVQVLREISA